MTGWEEACPMRPLCVTRLDSNFALWIAKSDVLTNANGNYWYMLEPGLPALATTTAQHSSARVSSIAFFHV
jgi:hypothetical protein